MGTFAGDEWFLERYSELTGQPVDAESLKTFQMLAHHDAAGDATHGRVDVRARSRRPISAWCGPGTPSRVCADDMVRLMQW